MQLSSCPLSTSQGIDLEVRGMEEDWKERGKKVRDVTVCVSLLFQSGNETRTQEDTQRRIGLDSWLVTDHSCQ